MRQLYEALHPKGKLINAHQSTYCGTPTLAFVHSYWDGEQFGRGELAGDPLQKLPLASFRAEFMGKNFGVPCEFLVYERPHGEYWTPNGNHRREAMARLGKGMIDAILVPDPKVAYQILALNTEKAHNLKEKALEVIRMYQGLLSEDGRIRESDYAFHFEEAHYITLGLLYEKRERFSGSAYVPVLRKVDTFLDAPLPEALKERERRAALLEEVDALVEPIVQSLRERGFNQPFLKQGVVSKVNPIKRKRLVDISYDEAMKRMKRALERLDPATITPEDLAAAVVEE
jgi:ParB family chromosome partitioning protein